MSPRASERRAMICVVALFFLAFTLLACGDDDDLTSESTGEEWGPLAVATGPPSGSEALITGTLDIGENCVTIRAGDDEESTLLVWPSEATTWNPASMVIEYSDGEGAVELSDGDEVSFGGGGDSVDEGGLSASEWIDSVDGWESEPDPSCPMEVRWFVGELAQTSSSVP